MYNIFQKEEKHPSGTKDNPFINNGKSWTHEDYRKMIRMYVQGRSVNYIALKLGRGIKAVSKRLALTVGYENPFEKDQKIIDRARRIKSIWEEKYKTQWEEEIEYEREKAKLAKEKAKERALERQVIKETQDREKALREQQTGINEDTGFYISGYKYLHRLYGEVTVLEDNEVRTVYQLADGSHKKVYKAQVGNIR